jgi:nickel/cobalt transporter (NicO) family protein
VDESNPLKRALADPALGLLGLLAALGLAFALGALHALSPGHGKTLVAAYLVGARGRVGHALLLGLVVSATHVAAVFALGLAALLLSERALPDRLLPWLEVSAALLVAALGAFMLLRRLRGMLLHRLAHAQGAEHDHDHDHEHASPEGVRTGELLWLGISGGLVPCPSATVVMLMAIYLGRVGLGLGLLGAFSLGLAATLVALGILVVKARGLAARLAGPRFQAWTRWAPLLSAGLILVIGAAMTVFALLRV